MIFLTVGSERFPFDRLVRGVDEWAGSGSLSLPLFGQIGTSLYEPRHFPWVRTLPYREMDERIRLSGCVICHGGVGTLLQALSYGKGVVALARESRWKEHLDDHQRELLERLQGTPGLTVLPSLEGLAEAVIGALEGSRGEVPPPSPQRASLVEYLSRVVGGRE